MASTKGKEALWVLAAVSVGVVFMFAVFGTSDDDSTVVTAPDATDQREVVAELERASAAHGICYGWRLVDSSGFGASKPVSVGSNLGTGVAVDGDPARCPRWIEVRGQVHYVSSSSESNDYATIFVASTGNLRTPRGGLDAAGLERLGVTTNRLIDDPGTTIVAAAELLPLLAVESGAATAPLPQASATGTPTPLAAAGNDFWRDRRGLIITAGVLLLVALGALLIGVHQGRKAKRAASLAPVSVPGPSTAGRPPNQQSNRPSARGSKKRR